MPSISCTFLLFFTLMLAQLSSLELGIDRLFTPKYISLIQGKRVAVATNHTGISSSFQKTEMIFIQEHQKRTCQLVCFFCPEHGFRGEGWAEESIEHAKHECGVPIYSLHGKTRRPTSDMLEGIDTIVFDMQDIGCRSYTYVSTLFYLMEEAAKKQIDIVVLDRPNPLGGDYVEGPMMENSLRSFIGYLNIPYCHGMTIGELALFFQKEYQVSCPVHVVPMKGWHRFMRFCDTSLPWIPPSPHIPSDVAAMLYPATGILGTLSFVCMGVGYTLPFQVVAAPWIDAKKFAAHLNKAKLPGIQFSETWIRPFFGFEKGNVCQGVQLFITDPYLFSPIKTFYLLISTLREIYPSKTLAALKKQAAACAKVCGSAHIIDIIQKEEHPYKALVNEDKAPNEEFLKRRLPYLLPDYAN